MKNWSIPTVTETNAGLEITSYAAAEIGEII